MMGPHAPRAAVGDKPGLEQHGLAPARRDDKRLPVVPALERPAWREAWADKPLTVVMAVDMRQSAEMQDGRVAALNDVSAVEGEAGVFVQRPKDWSVPGAVQRKLPGHLVSAQDAEAQAVEPVAEQIQSDALGAWIGLRMGEGRVRPFASAALIWC